MHYDVISLRMGWNILITFNCKLKSGTVPKIKVQIANH